MVAGGSAGSGAGRGAVRFLFDYISPNAYIAWTRIHDLARRAGRSVEPVPVLFAGLLQAHGLKGPAEIPAKWRWMLRDILRKASELGIDLEPPESHPFNPLLALRVSSLELAVEPRRRMIDALFRAVWAGGPGARETTVNPTTPIAIVSIDVSSQARVQKGRVLGALSPRPRIRPR